MVSVEVEIVSYRVAVHHGLPFDEPNVVYMRFMELEKLEGERIKAY